jgi:hypothetical protein
MGRLPVNTQPDGFRMKDLFLDVKLEACVGGSTFDFLGRKLFSAEFFREGVGFGITSIDIEVNTSLQPLVTVVFKDLYGQTVFGGQERHPTDALSIDYSVLFNWPPPKFLFSFKGYLGEPATWLLNLKRTSTSFNSSDGSYDVKCEFVPNQWGFFADMPFLYLLAAKKLRKDKLGPVAEGEAQRSVTSVFDLIKIGKQVEVKTQDTTKEFDDLVKKMGSMKSNIGRAVTVTNILGFNEKVVGTVNNQAIKGFQAITIPSLESLGDELGTIPKIETKLKNATSINALNTYLLLALEIQTGGDTSQSVSGFKRFNVTSDWKVFLTTYNNPTGRIAIDESKSQTLGFISDNLDKIDDEIKRRVFSTSEKKLEKITIGEVFSQIAKDSAFVMGSILDAGLDGYRGTTDRQKARDVLIVEKEILIGESFPLIISNDGEELPAINKNLEGIQGFDGVDIGVDKHEMQFVKDFITAISEGIAKDLLVNNPQAGQDDAKLKQRINNIEMSSGNPYKSYYQNIATNILVRGGIAAYFTRSSDPNLPGDFGGTIWGIDRDDVNSIQELAERDMQNVTDSIITNLSDVDFLLLRRFCVFMSQVFTVDGTSMADRAGDSGFKIVPAGFGFADEEATSAFLSKGMSYFGTKNLDEWQVVMSSPTIDDADAIKKAENDAIQSRTKAQNLEAGFETLTFNQIWKELYVPEIYLDDNVTLENGNLVFSDIEFEESKREDQIKAIESQVKAGVENQNSSLDSQDKLSAQGVRNAQNPLSFVDTKYTATRIVNNRIGYTFPTSNGNEYVAVFFKGEENKRAQEANSAPTDGEFKNENKDKVDPGQNEVLGYVSINAKYGDNTESDTTVSVGTGGKFMLRRIATLQGYRDGTTQSSPDNVLNFSKMKDPSPGFFGSQNAETNVWASRDILWNNSIRDSPGDNPQQLTNQKGVDYTGNIGYTIASHSGTDPDSGLVFGIFSPSQGGRNHRAFVRKASEVLLKKLDDIIDKRNQIIGEVLGKAGDSEAALYKQMHVLFHQWQTLSYSDKIDGNGALCGDVNEHKGTEGDENSKTFNVADALEARFGDNHVDLLPNEIVWVTKEEYAEGTTTTADDLSELFPPGTDRVAINLGDSQSAQGVPNGTFVYDYPMQRINSTGEPINVRDSIINLEPLYKPNANTSILNIIQQVCTKNNFMFIPIPGNPGYLDVANIWSPSPMLANLQVRNFFHVLFTPTPESRTKTKNTDGTALALSDQQKSYNVGSFVIKYGHPDNQIVKSISVGTDDNKVTAESIVNLQRLVDNENQNKKVTTDCSMLSVLAGRSYKATIDVLGNSQVYPMQFFFLENSPLFGGLYQVMKVKHAISPNDMSTSLEGIRMRFSPGSGYGSVKPVTLDTFRDLGESEAPLAIAPGFDKLAREAIKNFPEGLVRFSGNFSASAADYLGQDFVDGNTGGPVARSVPLIPLSVLSSSYDTSLGVRDLWSAGAIKGSAQMYMYDEYPVTGQILSAYKAMQTAALADDIELHLTSGYRDPFKNVVLGDGTFVSTAQYNLRKANVINKKYENDEDYLRNNRGGSKSFDPDTARPGWSNHNSGIAIDLNCKGAKFGGVVMPIYEWLVLNAYKYGFVRAVASEEWHWEYRPGSAQFQHDSRKGPKWYGLPDKLGIPLDKPAPESIAVVAGQPVKSKGNYSVYIVDGSGNVTNADGVVQYNKVDEFVITVPNTPGALEAAVFISGIEGTKESPNSGYRADIANGCPVSLSEKRVMVYANENSTRAKATTAMNGLLNGLSKAATVKSVMVYSAGGRRGSTAYSSGLRFFGFCDPVAYYGTYKPSYSNNTYLDTWKPNWGAGSADSYNNDIDKLIANIKNSGGVALETSNPHDTYPSFFLNKYKDKI